MTVRRASQLLLLVVVGAAASPAAPTRAVDSGIALGAALGSVDDIAAGLLKANKGSVTKSLDALSRMKLGQGKAVQVLEKTYAASGRGTAGTRTLADGTKVLLSRRVGPSQAVLGMNKAGQVRAGTATIEVTGNLSTPLRATNISF